MSYALISDDLLLQLEGAGVSRDARLLHLEAIVYSCTAHTDGAIKVRLARFSDAPNIEECAQELIDAGLWTRTDDGFQIVNYLMHQKSKEEIDRRKAEAAHRADRYRRHKRGDHSKCTKSSYCPDGALSHTSRVTSRVTNANEARDVRAPIQSDPIRSEGEGLDRNKTEARPPAPDSASGRELTDRELADEIRSVLAERGWQIPVEMKSKPNPVKIISPDGLDCQLYDVPPDEGVYFQVTESIHFDGAGVDPKLGPLIAELKHLLKTKQALVPRIETLRDKEGVDLWAVFYPLRLSGLDISTPDQQDTVVALIEDYARFIGTAFAPYLEATQAQVNDDE